MLNTKNKGDWGEKQAVAYLKENGFTILETNWRFKKLEIDIIAQIADKMVFVEVKTRGSNEYGEPETAVSLKKQRFIIKAANHYITEKDIDLEARFDIVGIMYIDNKIIVKHIPDAFYPIVK